MIRDLDATIDALIEQQAPAGSELAQASVSFDIPDGDWRAALDTLTVNCYLYDIRENRELRTAEDRVLRTETGARRRKPPVRIDCSYCITAWSPATSESTLDEHRLLSQILNLLLRNPTLPSGALQGSLVGQIPPYPTLIASPDGVKDQPDFWGALDQQLKPSLNYVVTLAMLIDDEPPETGLVEEVIVNVDDFSLFDRE